MFFEFDYLVHNKQYFLLVVEKQQRKPENMSGLPKSGQLAQQIILKNPCQRLWLIYSRTRNALQKIPPTAPYRKHTEEIVNHRLKCLEDAKGDMQEFEKLVNCGTKEQILKQAENELELIRRFFLYEPWHPLKTPPPPKQWVWPPIK